nr:hypothetical protein ICEMyc226_00226 [Mycolicibacterium sp.]
MSGPGGGDWPPQQGWGVNPQGQPPTDPHAGGYNPPHVPILAPGGFYRPPPGPWPQGVQGPVRRSKRKLVIGAVAGVVVPAVGGVAA